MKKLSSPQGIITDYPIVPPGAIKQAGFILSLPESEGAIIDTQSKLARFGLGETVYIDAGSDRGISPGDKFTVTRHDRFIHHPVLSSSELAHNFKEFQSYALGAGEGKPLGYLVRILGEIKVLEVNKDIAKAVVSESYEDMMVGDRIIASSTPQVLFEARKPEDKNIEGYIVASKTASTSLSTVDIVYLDVGHDQNVVLGDRFEVFAFPDLPSGEEVLPHRVGELLIINAQNATSTAIVLKGSDELKIGLKVSYKR